MKAILRQTSVLLLAQVLTKIVGFFYTIFLARTLGVAEFGLFTVALAYFSIVSSIADFGFNRYLIREVAKDKLKASELICNIAILRLTLTSIIFGVFALSLYLLDPDKLRVSLILVAVLAILPQGVALTFDGVFIAIHKLQFSAIALIASGLTTAVFGFYLVSGGLGNMGAVNALILGQIIYVLVLFAFLLKHKIVPLNVVTTVILKKALRESLPYGLLGVLGLLYFRIDSLLLSYIRGNFETGLYGAAYKFLEAIIFIPSSFAAALFPALAKLHNVNLKEMKNLYFKSLRLMVFLGLITLTGYIFILPLVVTQFLPGYIQSIESIRILSLSIPFIFAATPGVQVLLSTDKYLKTVLGLSVFTVLFNVILNILFIPRFGFIGASWVTVFSDVLSFVIFYLLVTEKVFHEKK